MVANSIIIILHLREFPFIAHILIQKLLYNLPLPSNPILLLILSAAPSELPQYHHVFDLSM